MKYEPYNTQTFKTLNLAALKSPEDAYFTQTIIKTFYLKKDERKTKKSP